MAQGFRSTPRGMVAHLDAQERNVLRRLFEDVLSMVELGAEAQHAGVDSDPLEDMLGLSDEDQPPADPALRRLLPDASLEPERAQEFRRYTERTLREDKAAVLRRCAMVVEHDPIQLNGSAIQDFARGLNDVRLVLASRLNIESSDDASAVERTAAQVDLNKLDDPEDYIAVVYVFVSWLQNSLVEAMVMDLPDEPQSV
ncbi:MAG: DUF2017 domain-containing protein [Kocuria sp.]|nr:DUF2017 domain-containing protein [Kocuria sp.]